MLTNFRTTHQNDDTNNEHDEIGIAEARKRMNEFSIRAVNERQRMTPNYLLWIT